MVSEKEINKLMLQASSMEGYEKSVIICRLFAYIEIIQSRDESITGEDLYNEIKKSVHHLTKENS